MSEQFAPVGEIDLCYETFGSPDAPPMLLVMGLGAQMLLWDEELCQRLALCGELQLRIPALRARPACEGERS